jgi:hypothetical protein
MVPYKEKEYASGRGVKKYPCKFVDMEGHDWIKKKGDQQ